MTTLATMLAAAQRLLTYYNGDEKTAQNPGGLTGVGGMADNWDPCIQDIGTVANGVGDAMTAASTSEGNAAESAEAAADSAQSAQQDAAATAADRQATGQDRQATSADRQAVAQDRTAADSSASAASTSAALSGQYAAAAGGSIPSVRLTWDTGTADADPGNGKVRANNAALTGATALYLDNLDMAGASITTVLDRWTASTNTTKGTLRIAHRTDATKWVEYLVTGTVVDGTGYRKITVTGGTGPGGFAAGDPVAIGFSRAGDAGVTPASFAPGTMAAPGWAVTGDSDTGLAQLHGANSLSLLGGGIERLCLLPNGNIGIGTGAPGAEFEIADTAGDGDVRINLRASASIIGQIGRSLAAMFIDTVTGQPFQFFIGGFEQLRVLYVANANRYATIAGSNGGNPTISTSGGALNLTSATGQVLVNGAAISAAAFPVVSKSAAYTVTASDASRTFACTGTFQLSLLASTIAGNGFPLVVYNGGTGQITVKPAGAETIGGAGAAVVGPGTGILIVCDGASAWSVVGTTLSVTALDPTAMGASVTLSNANLTALNSTGIWSSVRTNTPITAGKWYLRFRQEVTDASPTKVMVGLAASTVSMVDGQHIGGANCWSLADSGQLSVNGSGTAGWSPAWGAVGKVVGLYIDATILASIKIWFEIDGVMIASGDPATGANPAATITGSPTLYPAVALINGQQISIKASKASWTGAAPVSGYNALP